jgi:fucose 4-O-acetylase-like acetyltransferase
MAARGRTVTTSGEETSGEDKSSPLPPGDQTRDFSLDLLRAIAILEVVLAHSGVPPWLLHARNFGVPLLMILSGWSISLATAGRVPALGRYLRRRMIRLVVPSWAFLVVYFALMIVWSRLASVAWWHPPGVMLDAFAFGWRFPFVWVIRVNLLISIVTPALIALDRPTVGDWTVLAMCFGATCLGSALWFAMGRAGLCDAGSCARAFLPSTLFYLLGYGALFGLGLRVSRLPPIASAKFGLFWLVVFVASTLWLWIETGTFASTGDYKYPPRLHYVAYAAAISLFLIAGRHHLAALLPGTRTRAFVTFIGSQTLWIYLWHILTLQIMDGAIDAGWLPAHYVVRWLGTAGLAIAAVWVQSRLLVALTPHLPDRARPWTRVLGAA